MVPHGSRRGLPSSATPWRTYRAAAVQILICAQVRQRLLSVAAPRLLKSPVSSSRNSCPTAPWFETPFGLENWLVAAELKSGLPASHGDGAHHGASLGTPLANRSSSFSSFFNRLRSSFNCFTVSA